MTFPTATASAQGGFDALTSHSILVPACSIGQLVVLHLAVQNAVSTTTSMPAGWTKQGGELSDGEGFIHVVVFTHVIDGTESWYNGGAGGNVTVTHSAAQTCTGALWLVTGASGTVAIASSGGLSVDPDPPNLTPPWGAQDTLWLAGYGITDWTNYYAPPTNYTGDVYTRWPVSNSAVGISSATAKRALNAASENPGFFDSDIGRWAAWTLAVAPVGAGARSQGVII